MTTCSYQSAQIAAEGRDYVTSVDTKHVTAGQMLVILSVARYLETHSDCSLKKAISIVKNLSCRCRMGFFPGDLVYLRAGGRVSNAEYLGAKILSLKLHNREIPSGYVLPANEFCGVERWKEAKVQYMCHIEIGRKYYSVPWSYLGKTVKVKLTRDHVEIFYEEERIAIHARLYGEQAWYATDPAHMPPYGANVEWNKDRFLSMARKIGPSIYKVIKINLEMKEIEQQMYFDCRMILKLSSDYTPELLELACRTLLEKHIIPWRKNMAAQIEALSTMPMHVS